MRVPADNNLDFSNIIDVYQYFLLVISVFERPLFQSNKRLCYENMKPLNSLPNNKILDWSKLKVFTDDKMKMNKEIKLVLGRVENILGKGEMLITSIVCFSNNVFKSLLFHHC